MGIESTSMLSASGGAEARLPLPCRRRSFSAAWGLLLLLALASGVTDPVAWAQETPPEVTNPTCPVLPDESVDPAIFTEYDGRRVYFCCQKCRMKFLRDPAPYLSRLPAPPPKIGATAPTSSPVPPIPPAAPAAPDAGRARPRAVESVSGWQGAIHLLGTFHPAVVHFPIALVLAALLAEGLFLRTGNALYDGAARYSIVIAGISAVATAILGWAAGASTHVSGDLALVLAGHRWGGTAIGLLVPLTALFSELSRRPDRPRMKRGYRMLLMGVAVLVVVTGHLGGILVFGFDHYSTHE